MAGPFRASTPWQIQQNIRRAEELSLEVAKLGAMPLCPHKNTENFHGLLTDEFLLNGTMDLLRRCDAVVLCDGWKQSIGTRGEVEEAKRLGIPVYQDIDDLDDWLRYQP